MLKDAVIVIVGVWVAAILVKVPALTMEGTNLLNALIVSMGFSVLGLILGLIFLFVKRESPSRLRIALIAGILGVALPALGTILGGADSPRDSFSSNSQDVSFQPEGCEFLVVFPVAYEVSDVNVSGSDSFREAQAIYKDGMYRADCTKVDVASATNAVGGTENFLKLLGEENAKRSGIYPFSVRILTGEFSSAEMTGNKIVAGNEATYTVRYALGTSSILTTYVGSKNTEYPHKGFELFLNSISKQ